LREAVRGLRPLDGWSLLHAEHADQRPSLLELCAPVLFPAGTSPRASTRPGTRPGTHSSNCSATRSATAASSATRSGAGACPRSSTRAGPCTSASANNFWMRQRSKVLPCQSQDQANATSSPRRARRFSRTVRPPSTLPRTPAPAVGRSCARNRTRSITSSTRTSTSTSRPNTAAPGSSTAMARARGSISSYLSKARWCVKYFTWEQGDNYPFGLFKLLLKTPRCTFLLAVFSLMLS
jgi:hypothetical protein